MAEIPHLIQDLALILMVAGLVTLLFKKLRQPLVLGYSWIPGESTYAISDVGS